MIDAAEFAELRPDIERSRQSLAAGWDLIQRALDARDYLRCVFAVRAEFVKKSNRRTQISSFRAQGCRSEESRPPESLDYSKVFPSADRVASGIPHCADSVRNDGS